MPAHSDEVFSLEDLKGLNCLLPSFHPNFEHPTARQVNCVVSCLGLSQRQAAKLLGVVYNDKGSPTIRRWKTDESFNEHRKIPYASWRLLIEYAGLASTEETLEVAKKHL